MKKWLRDAFTGKNEGKEERKEAADRPKKKSNLIQVFRPQNSTDPGSVQNVQKTDETAV